MLSLDAVKQKAFALGVLPVIKLDRVSDARPLADALIRGGLPAAEVTFRTDAAPDAIRAMREAHPEMLICAGTVLTPKQVDEAISAGASFIVSPGLSERVVLRCQERGVPVIPGCATPSDLERALGLGLTTVKFFPAEAAGGLAAIKAMSAPYPVMQFMPTGGISAGNLAQYLSFKKILCCGGSFMVPGAALSAGDFAQITALTREAVRAVHGFTLKSVPAPHEADAVSALLGIEGDETVVEVRSLARACAYLSLIGAEITGNENVSRVRTAGRTVTLRENAGC